MTTETRLITAEELFCMPDDDMQRELIRGVVVESMPPGYEHNGVMAELMLILGAYVKERGLGRVIPGDVGVILQRDPDTVRGPDICYISTERLPASARHPGYLDTVPDLIVEIVSPNDKAAEVRAKTEAWLRAGARLVWTLYPSVRCVVVSTTLGEDRILYEHDTLTGDPVLPDFATPVGALFA